MTFVAWCPQHKDKGFYPDSNDPNRCALCVEANRVRVTGNLAGSGKKKGHHVFQPNSYPTYPGMTLDGRIKDLKHFSQWLEDLAADPIRSAEVAAESRRPRGVSSRNQGIALRSSLREPMLSANDPFKHVRLTSKPGGQARLKAVKRFSVKPNTSRTALGNWLVREWSFWDLKYSKGFVIVDQNGRESNIYKSWHEAKKAIEASGFDLIQSPGRKAEL